MVTSVWPAALIVAALLAFAALIVRTSSFYNQLTTTESASGSRFHAIDGLRGYLALSVFFHHAVISFYYYRNGRWDLPPSQFYSNIGQAGVALFFMITAFLFWNKGLHRPPSFETSSFFWSRLTRLTPMYVFSVLSVLFVACVLTNFEMHGPIADLISSAVSWGSFALIEPRDFNGYKNTWIINGVYWTLKYEWLFYFFLPFGLIFCRGAGFALMFAIAAAVIQLFSTRPVEWYFLAGALAAVLNEKYKVRSTINWNSPPITLTLVATIAYLAFMAPHIYTPASAVLLFICFFCITNGNDLFGLLSLKSSRFLGIISYSLYLLHCTILFIVLRAVNKLAPIEKMPPEYYWAVVAFCAAVTLMVSSITYRLIEHPWMRAKMPAWLASNSYR